MNRSKRRKKNPIVETDEDEEIVDLVGYADSSDDGDGDNEENGSPRSLHDMPERAQENSRRLAELLRRSSVEDEEEEIINEGAPDPNTFLEQFYHTHQDQMTAQGSVRSER